MSRKPNSLEVWLEYDEPTTDALGTLTDLDRTEVTLDVEEIAFDDITYTNLAPDPAGGARWMGSYFIQTGTLLTAQVNVRVVAVDSSGNRSQIMSASAIGNVRQRQELYNFYGDFQSAGPNLRFWETGTPYWQSGDGTEYDSTYPPISASNIAQLGLDPDETELFQTEVYGTAPDSRVVLTNIIPGDYICHVYMREQFWNQVGDRIMSSLVVNGVTFATNIDLFGYGQSQYGEDNAGIEFSETITVTGVQTVTIDITMTVENPTVSAIRLVPLITVDEDVPIEYNRGAKLHWLLPGERLSSRQIDMALPVEYEPRVALIVDVTGELPVELLATMPGFRNIPIEYLGRASSQHDDAMPIDWLKGLRRDRGVPAEWSHRLWVFDQLPVEYLGTASLLSDRLLPISYLESMRADQSAPVEHVAEMDSDSAAPVEYLGVTQHTSDGMPVAWLAKILTIQDMPAEWTQALIAFGNLPIEFLGEASIQADGFLPAEWIRRVARNQGIPAELLAKVRGDESLPVEYRTLVDLAETLPIELVRSVGQSGDLPTEIGLEVRTDKDLPVEFLLIADIPTGELPIEWISGLAVDVTELVPISWGQMAHKVENVPVEYVGRTAMQSDQAVPIEWRAVIQTDGSVPAEWGISVTRIDDLPVEWTAQLAVLVDRDLPVEYMEPKFVNFDEDLPIEFGGRIGIDAFSRRVFIVKRRQ